MTIQEIEKIIEGHYHPTANIENILKMWNIIEKSSYQIAYNEFRHKYIIISDETYKQIIKEVSKIVLHLRIIGNKTFIINKTEWDILENQRKAIEQQVKAEQKKLKRQNEPHGIYCIKYKDEIIYIGMTQTSFKERYREHKTLFNNPDNSDMLLYHAGLKFEELEFKVMVDLTKEKADRELTTRDIKAMEMGLIACFKPKYNVSGVRIPYRFS